MSTDYKITCPNCGKSIEVPAEFLGQTGDCPYCDQPIKIPDAPQHKSAIEKTSQVLSTAAIVTKKSFLTVKIFFNKVKNALPEKKPPRKESNLLKPKAPATEKQLKYIEALGGTVNKKCNMQQASDLIEELIRTQPATEKQLKRLARDGVDISKPFTKIQATELISQITDAKPPTKTQVKLLIEFETDIPETRGEASQLCEDLKNTSKSTNSQRLKANALGGAIPINATYLETQDLIEEFELDNDSEQGKPPKKAQINKIIKLGGDLAKAKNRWRAENYIVDLEYEAEGAKEEFEIRIDDALDVFFGPYCSAIFKKPTKSIMQKVLHYGEQQGWGMNWESDLNLDYYELMDFAVYTIAPDRLKDGYRPPKKPKGIK